MTNNLSESLFPDRVSSRVVDAWKVKPPCEFSSDYPYCHVQCPYYFECHIDDE